MPPVQARNSWTNRKGAKPLDAREAGAVVVTVAGTSRRNPNTSRMNGVHEPIETRRQQGGRAKERGRRKLGARLPEPWGIPSGRTIAGIRKMVANAGDDIEDCRKRRNTLGARARES